MQLRSTKFKYYWKSWENNRKLETHKWTDIQVSDWINQKLNVSKTLLHYIQPKGTTMSGGGYSSGLIKHESLRLSFLWCSPTSEGTWVVDCLPRLGSFIQIAPMGMGRGRGRREKGEGERRERKEKKEQNPPLSLNKKQHNFSFHSNLFSPGCSFCVILYNLHFSANVSVCWEPRVVGTVSRSLRLSMVQLFCWHDPKHSWCKGKDWGSETP